MKSTLENFLEAIPQVETLEHFQAATETLRDNLGFEHVVYHWVNSVGERFGAGTYSSEWVDRYLEKITFGWILLYLDVSNDLLP
jgi:hypothetical protein